MKRSLFIICIALLLCVAVYCSNLPGNIAGFIAGITGSESQGENPEIVEGAPENSNPQTPETPDSGSSETVTPGENETEDSGNTEDDGNNEDVKPDNSVTQDVVTENNVVAGDTLLANTDSSISAFVPAGAVLNEGVSSLTFSVTEVEESNAQLIVTDRESVFSIDVHVEGLSADNEALIEVYLKELLPAGLNMGNYTLSHVENGVTNAMTLLGDGDEPVHNGFVYDPATGDVTMYLKSFSEIAVVSNVDNAWNGTYDYTWYDANATELTIANADQLAGFGAIVGGMPTSVTCLTEEDENYEEGASNIVYTYAYTDAEGYHNDTFSGKTVTLLADINIGDTDSENGKVFYPIGYYNTEGTYKKTQNAITSGFMTFEGTFDGNGHTISNWYQNTWEMKGDHNWYDASLQYYRDGMGLFGKVYGGTVKNLTVENFSSDGEIATTGTIAAYADFGATFENITIFNCNPRVYNIGNGGIVGCVGWYTEGVTDTPVSFKNITVDNSNKISALWGSWDVACGGVVGQYYPTSGQSSANYPKNAGIYMENCHVAAQIDVYNDVCANYQYYAYRYAGMLIGSVRENETKDGHVYPKMDSITFSNCTVNFGTWNDYYYCELVANTSASYTHDYQMSRLTEIKAIDGATITYLDGTTGTVPESGRANYVIVDYDKGHGTENATCYHFVNGAEWKHDDAGTETVDGVEGVLKEDKQHIYLEFNNLVTGYGWGVTSKGIKQADGVTVTDIGGVGLGEHDKSITKFESATTNDLFASGVEYNIGDIFKVIEGIAPGVISNNVHVTVSPVGENSTVGGIYTANAEDWTQGTLQFTGAGVAQITITDYFFCIKTVITVNVQDSLTITIGDKSYTAAGNKWVYNTKKDNNSNGISDPANACYYDVLVYTKGIYTDSIVTNTNCVMLVVDKYGVLTDIYDGANAFHCSIDNISTGRESHSACVGASYADTIFQDLEDDETIIIFTNKGTNELSISRTWALSVRNVDGTGAYVLDEDGNHPYFGKTMTIEGIDGLEFLTHECDSVCPFCGKCINSNCTEGNCAYNKCDGCPGIAINGNIYAVASADKVYNYDGKSGPLSNHAGVFTYLTTTGRDQLSTNDNWNSWVVGNKSGVAVALNEYGQIVRIYNQTDDYLSTALSELQSGETLLFVLNVSSGDNADLIDYVIDNSTIGAQVYISGVTFEEKSVVTE